MAEWMDIPGEVVADAQAAQGFDLIVPEDARVSRDGNSAFWREAGTIRGAQSAEPKEKSYVEFLLEVKLNHEGSGKNADRVLFSRQRINFKALRSKEPEGQWKMSRMSTAKLNALFRSIGLEPDRDDGGYSIAFLKAAFPPESSFPGDPSPLLHRNIYFEVRRDHNRTDKEGKALPPQVEITAFFPPE